MGRPSLIKGIHVVSKKQPGKPVRWYVYAWRGGPLIHSVVGGSKPKLGADQLEAYRKALDEHRRPANGTLLALIVQWRASPEWSAMADSTRSIWGPMLAKIEAKWGNVPLAVFDDRRMREKVVTWRDSFAATPRTADNHVTVLRALLEYGRMRGRLGINVADGISGLYKGGNRAAIIWTPLEREVLADGLDWQLHDAFELLCLSGLRRGDAVAVPLDAVGDHAIVWRTSKSRGERIVTVPMHPRLRAHVEKLRTRHRAPGVSTLLVNSRGEPWTPGGLTGSFNVVRDAIGFDKHLHDCRGTFVTELCLLNPPLTDQEIAGIVGWSPVRVGEIRRVYVDQARVVVAIGERMANSAVNRTVNHSR